MHKFKPFSSSREGERDRGGMPAYFFVTAMTNPSGTARSRPCATLENALRGANFLLGNGAASVWIVDGDDNLVLTAEQVRLRRKQPVVADVADRMTAMAAAHMESG